jgi:hypothetical protein
MTFSKVVIWGHPLHSHTNSYVFDGYFKAFKFLGFDTYWLTDRDDVSGIDFSNSLFFTEHQDDEKMPKRADCKYILHNCPEEEYAHIPSSNRLSLQVYRASCPEHNAGQYVAEKIDNGVFFGSRTLYQPWATNLLPHEINLDFANTKRTTTCNWVGTIGGQLYGNEDQINPFKRACEENGIKFAQHGPTRVSNEDHMRLIQESYVSPGIHGLWQCQNGYVSDRLFKSISYGHLGITNCRAAQDFFSGELVFNEDTYQLFYDAKPCLGDSARIQNQMRFVKAKHTFINRIETILSVL